MPQFLADRLKAEARKQGKTGEDADRYVYGAMNNMGAMRGNKETAKGKRMQAKHEADEKKRGHRERRGKSMHSALAAYMERES